jgi:hypothetical protein
LRGSVLSYAFLGKDGELLELESLRGLSDRVGVAIHDYALQRVVFLSAADRPGAGAAATRGTSFGPGSNVPEQTEIPLCKELTLIVGENNGGKSNAIDAIRLLTAPLGGRRGWLRDIRDDQRRPLGLRIVSAGY